MNIFWQSEYSLLNDIWHCAKKLVKVTFYITLEIGRNKHEKIKQHTEQNILFRKTYNAVQKFEVWLLVIFLPSGHHFIPLALKINKNGNEGKHLAHILVEQIIFFRMVYNIVQKISKASREKEELSAKPIFFFNLPFYWPQNWQKSKNQNGKERNIPSDRKNHNLSNGIQHSAKDFQQNLESNVKKPAET